MSLIGRVRADARVDLGRARPSLDLTKRTPAAKLKRQIIVRRLWRDSVLDAIQRLSSHGKPAAVTRAQLIAQELPTIVTETQSAGGTPHQTLSRELQQLRDEGMVEFLGRGRYRLTKPIVNVETFVGTQNELDSAIKEGRLRIGKIETGTDLALQRRRRGQERLRKLALDNYGRRCAVCDLEDQAILWTSHIIPWAESEDGRGKLTNVLILCRPHDSLFEFGYWSLDDELAILKHPEKGKSWVVQALLPNTISFCRPRYHAPACEYLRFHRNRHGFSP
jgi:DNA-binding transcriptional ArsR family regulator